YPVARLVSAVITRLEDRALADGDLHAALVDRGGRWVAPGVVAGFGGAVDGLASPITTDFNILVLRRRPEALARPVDRALGRPRAGPGPAVAARRRTASDDPPGGRRPRGRAAGRAGRPRFPASRADVHAVLPRRRLPAVRAALSTRRVGRQAGQGAAAATG